MPDPLANKIAAGEVVQRPASVAKELMENALDAGADHVQLIIKDAGRTLVQVIDDGCGMSAADATRCFKRHATSKIQSVEDLERIQTLGFRGEALASIGAVAQVELKTKRVEDEVGHYVRVEGGEIVTQEPTAAPDGTSIAVRNLFYNVPARRNFLKTPATEFRHLTETFQKLALPNPTVAFTLVHNDNEIYDLAAVAGDSFLDRVRTRIIDVLGTEREGRLVPVDDGSSYLTVCGFVSEPEFHRKTRGEQFLFVNGRAVQSRYLSHAVRAAYDDLLPDGAFPFFALFLTVDPKRVDVNVHPTKAEVKFDDKSGVYGFLRGAVQQSLRAADVTPQLSDAQPASTPSTRSTAPRTQRSAPSGRETDRSGDSSERSPSSRSGTSSRSAGQNRSGSGTRRPGDWTEALYRPPAPSETPEEEQESASSDETDAPDQSGAKRGRPVWNLHGRYLLTPSEDGLMVVDQRAAHVRVLYERMLRDLNADDRAESQQLLFPHTVDLSSSDVELFEELQPDLRALGFDVARLSGRTVAVRAVPAGLGDNSGDALEAVLEQYKSSGKVTGERPKRLARALAQRHAVQRGQTLALEERRALLDDLWACDMPYADPSGNPTLLDLSMEELARLLRK